MPGSLLRSGTTIGGRPTLGMQNLGAIIRQRREKLGLKVYELAKKVGINPVYVTQIEKHGKLPSYKVINSLEQVLNVDLWTLYMGEKHPEVLKKIGVLAKRGNIGIKQPDKSMSTADRIRSTIMSYIQNPKNQNLKSTVKNIVSETRLSRITDKNKIELLEATLKRLKKEGQRYQKALSEQIDGLLAKLG